MTQRSSIPALVETNPKDSKATCELPGSVSRCGSEPLSQQSLLRLGLFWQFCLISHCQDAGIANTAGMGMQTSQGRRIPRGKLQRQHPGQLRKWQGWVLAGRTDPRR